MAQKSSFLFFRGRGRGHTSVDTMARVRWILKWMETTLTTRDHHHNFVEPLFAHDASSSLCDLCSETSNELAQSCSSCERRLCAKCAANGSEGCAVCKHRENFFVTCCCGVDECYNYWGINPKLETYFRCRRHRNALADRCVERVKCSTCRNKVPFPLCEKCPNKIPDVVRCPTCIKWSLG
jgi:hypothetical protein